MALLLTFSVALLVLVDIKPLYRSSLIVMGRQLRKFRAAWALSIIATLIPSPLKGFLLRVLAKLSNELLTFACQRRLLWLLSPAIVTALLRKAAAGRIGTSAPAVFPRIPRIDCNTSIGWTW